MSMDFSSQLNWLIIPANKNRHEHATKGACVSAISTSQSFIIKIPNIKKLNSGF